MQKTHENTGTPTNVEARPAALGKLLAFAVSDGRQPAATPLMPTGRDMQRYLIAALLCALPCLGLAAHYLGWRIWAMLTVATVSGALVEFVFARIRHKRLSGGTLAYAALLVLVLPQDLPLWMVALGSGVGTLFGKEVFGGTGSYIFSPVLVGKGFLLFSYPQDAQGTYFGSMLSYEGNPEAWLVCSGAICCAAVVFAVARPANLRILAAVLLGAVGVALAMSEIGRLPYETPVELIAADGFLFAAVFFAVDPACSPQDDEGKWLFGLLVGVTAVLMRCFSTYSEAMLSALLFGNLFTPMIDAIAVTSETADEDTPEGRAA